MAKFIKLEVCELRETKFRKKAINIKRIKTITEDENKGTAIIMIGDTMYHTKSYYEDIIALLDTVEPAVAPEKIDLSDKFQEVYSEYWRQYPDVDRTSFLNRYKDLLTPNIMEMYPNLVWNNETKAYVAYCKAMGIDFEASMPTNVID